jgi:putative endonuclease
MDKRETGRFGEDLAEKFLEKNGIKILTKNYFTKYGEIDLIGFQNRTIIFIEVKLRNSTAYGEPGEAISKDKLKKISLAADIYLSLTKIEYDECRFDAVLISRQFGNYKIEWLKNQNFN